MTLRDMRISTEDDFKAHLLRKHTDTFGSYLVLFPNVTKIGGIHISPDIDLLKFGFRSDAPPSYENNILTSYEFKLLNFKKAERNYIQIRNGFAQTLENFQFGIDKSWLVLGVPKDMPNSILGQVGSRWNELQLLLRSFVVTNRLDCIGLMMWFEDRDIMFNMHDASGSFPHHLLKQDFQFRTFDLNRKNLLDLRFTWNRRFLRKHGLPEPGWRVT